MCSESLKDGTYYVLYENLCDEYEDCIDGSDETEGLWDFWIFCEF